MIIAQPRNGHVLKELLSGALKFNAPTALRYPNTATETSTKKITQRTPGQAEILQKGDDNTLLLISLGTFYKTAFEVSDILKGYDIHPTIVDPVFLKPLDKKLFSTLLSSYKYIATIEEHSLSSGLGSIINSFAIQQNIQNRILNFGIADIFVHHGSNKELLQQLKLDAPSIAKKIIDKCSFKKNKITAGVL